MTDWGNGCFWHVQHELIQAEKKILGRTDDELTSYAGYAGARTAPTDNKLCYHNMKGINDYGRAGAGEVLVLIFEPWGHVTLPPCRTPNLIASRPSRPNPPRSHGLMDTATSPGSISSIRSRSYSPEEWAELQLGSSVLPRLPASHDDVAHRTSRSNHPRQEGWLEPHTPKRCLPPRRGRLLPRVSRNHSHWNAPAVPAWPSPKVVSVKIPATKIPEFSKAYFDLFVRYDNGAGRVFLDRRDTQVRCTLDRPTDTATDRGRGGREGRRSPPCAGCSQRTDSAVRGLACFSTETGRPALCGSVRYRGLLKPRRRVMILPART